MVACVQKGDLSLLRPPQVALQASQAGSLPATGQSSEILHQIVEFSDAAGVTGGRQPGDRGTRIDGLAAG